MPKAIVMSGIPGSGKSTWVKNNAKDYVVCSADAFFIRGGVYTFDASKLGAAHGRCFARFTETLASGQDVVVDNTNLSYKEAGRYIEAALVAGYEVQLVSFSVPPEICAVRNIHGVPLISIERMAQKMMVIPGRISADPKFTRFTP